MTMPRSNAARKKPDPTAIASKGIQTSQIETQTSGDRPQILSTLDEI